MQNEQKHGNNSRDTNSNYRSVYRIDCRWYMIGEKSGHRQGY
ncbi:hypothetical protein SAMN05661096_01355 [Marivirga sericea]|uniref:Uncharacterized protein n=1 Tax=Marivirga sericea TaxID=1028 RepID=A0A1X7J6P5_9BACT|nr:hypothetical protein SAMN05661096_01355 [Marivirga sericea]